MTHEQYIDCLIFCLIGNVLHVIMKIRSLAKDHKGSNLDFSWRGYLRDDKWALIFDLGTSVTLVFLADEWMGDLGSYALGKLKTVFFFVGFTGSYIVLQATSVAKEKYRQAVKFKTNKSDEQDGTQGTPTPTSEDKQNKN